MDKLGIVPFIKFNNCYYFLENKIWPIRVITNIVFNFNKILNLTKCSNWKKKIISWGDLNQTKRKKISCLFQNGLYAYIFTYD